MNLIEVVIDKILPDYSDTVYRSILNKKVNMTNQTLQVTAAEVIAASGYIDVFGLAASGQEPALHVKRRFRELQTQFHPDRFQDTSDKQVATKAFMRLAELHADALRAIRMEQYGKAERLMVMKTPKGEHVITKLVGSGDLATTYLAESSVNGVTVQSFVKVVKDHRNNDLMKTEAKALELLHRTDTQEKWHPYVSGLIDSFVYAELRKPRRRTNVLVGLPDFYTLDQLRQYFPQGVPAIHAAWMWRRLLMALGFAHESGVIHGAVLPSHVMILPKQHGLTLIDWCYASIPTDSKYPPLVALVNEYREWYPEEVLGKLPPSPATDIYMAAKCMTFLLGGNPLTGVMPDAVPRQLRAFFRGCMQSRQSARPQNAWLLLKEFDELLQSVGSPYYPRRYREFVVPTGTR
ncbi:MAG: hypothetical protein ACOH18_01605 [Candidatus Saccharimonadaceae bacterium]